MSEAADALRQKYGEEGAFSLIDRMRTGGRIAPSEQPDLQGLDLPRIDRELEGGMTGIAAIPAAAAYEYLLKPAVKFSAQASQIPGSPMPDINPLLPEAFRYQEGVTSPSSWGNIAAAAHGALSTGRIIPKAISDFASRQAAALRNRF